MTQHQHDVEPVISRKLQLIEVESGGRARFECKVDGRPKPSVIWSKDGKLLTASNRVRIMEVCGTHSLVISRAEHADAGIYSLSASNHLGSESCTATLAVKDAAPGGTTNGSEIYRKTAASRLVTGNIWAGSAAPSTRTSPGAGGPAPRRRGPGFILRPRPQSVSAGESLCLKCTLLGHPKPTVTWEKDGELVDEERTDGHIRTRIDGNNYFLEIETCSGADAGKYAVTAKNSLGKQTASVEVTVTESDGSVVAPRSKSSSVSSTKSVNHVVTSRTTSSSRIVPPSSPPPADATATAADDKPNMTLILPRAHEITTGSKPSPTESVSSTLSSHSRISTASSSRSHATDGVGAGGEQHVEVRSEVERRRANMVAPTFTRRLSSTQVLEGEELLLQCEVSGEPEPDLAWLRNGVEFGGMAHDEVFISFRNGVARLRLRDVQIHHAGEYICRAQNDAGVVKCSSRVTVKAKPVQKRPRFLKSPSDVRVTEGETLQLEAEVEGSPSPEVVWSLDGEEIPDAECTFVNNVAKLILVKVTSSSSGQYMCNALNSGGEDSVACRVRVKQRKLDIPPEFTAPLSDVRIAEGADICLRCMVTGIPEPRVEWLCNGEMLSAEEEGVELSCQGGVVALTVEQATVDDMGEYTCVAVNGEGEARTTCKVVVTAGEVAKTGAGVTPEKKPVPVPPKLTHAFDEYIRTQEGDVVTLDCRFAGHPEPEVTWTANGAPVENGVATVENGSARLVISPVTSSNSGQVKCCIKNSAGKATHETRLSVRSRRVAPTIEHPLPDTIEVGEDEEAEFHCTVRGHPQPRVSWTRDGRSLSILSTETSYEDGKASVKIRKATSRDGGKYVCTARNLSGDVDTVCEVRVVAKAAPRATAAPAPPPATAAKPTESAPTTAKRSSAPLFTKTLSNVTLDDGQDLRLECHVTGSPEPEVTWQVDGEKLEQDEGDATYSAGACRLLLEDVMKEDSGVYLCVATNSRGTDETSCRVVVRAPEKADASAAPPAAAAVVEDKDAPAPPQDKEPSFPIQLEDMTVKEGDDILLTCKVTGNPRPKTTWLLDGEEIMEADIKYAEDGSLSILLIEALPDDEGVYTCIAENHLKRVMCSCRVTIEPTPRDTKKSSAAAQPTLTLQTSRVPVNNVDTTPEESRSPTKPSVKAAVGMKPTIVEGLADRTVADGSKNFKLTCRVTGNPTPVARWMFDQEEIEPSEDFQLLVDGELRTLVFAEVFPEDQGTYTCVVSNSEGEAKSTATLNVEEIEGDAPVFLVKPRPMSVNAGETATFTCRVDGDPTPTTAWMFCNRPISDVERIHITPGDKANNYTHAMEITDVSSHDAGRYSVVSRNLLGDVTCTFSLIVNDVKRTETRKDFRDVLKKSASVKPKEAAKTGSGLAAEEQAQVDFRSVLRKTSSADIGKRTTSSGSEDSGPNDPGTVYKDALSVAVKTKALTEDERKLKRAEQVDFRKTTLVRKVDTKVADQESLRARAPEQQDFREEALKTRVQTKHTSQDEIKNMQAEQKDFRPEAIKTKVVTKAYREEIIKARKAEQVDFRKVLSPTKKQEMEFAAAKSGGGAGGDDPATIADIPRATWKKSDTDNTTVSTKRSRHGRVPTTMATTTTGSGGGAEKRVANGSGSLTPPPITPVGFKPAFVQPLQDLEISDGDPFELVCRVEGSPQPVIKWYLDDEEVKAEADIIIQFEDDGTCQLAIAESFPDDAGTYRCRASNEHGETECSARVVVVSDGESV